MDDSVKTMIKLAAVAIGGYLLYDWLQKNGYWAQWFGGNSFTDSAKLLAYCTANPTGSATYAGGAQSVTATCQQWLAAQKPAPAAPISNTTVPVVSDLAAKVLQAAGGTGAAMNADGWNYYWSQVSGAPQTSDLFPAGNRDAQLSFDQYLAARKAKGLSGRISFLPTYSSSKWLQ